MGQIRLKLNRKLHGKGPGVVLVEAGPDGKTPKAKFWRDRLTDAKQDNCCELVQSIKSIPKKMKGEEND